MKTTFKVKFRRRRDNLTDYRKRLQLLKGRKPRLVVRRLNRQTVAQVVEYTKAGDTVRASASSMDLKKYGWVPSGNLPSAYLTGLLCGLRAKKAGVKEAVLDTGLHTNLNKGVFACLKGAVDAGVEIPHGESAFPPEEMITGATNAEWAKGLDKEKYAKQFSAYVAAGFKPEEMPAAFEKAKGKITSEYSG